MFPLGSQPSPGPFLKVILNSLKAMVTSSDQPGKPTGAGNMNLQLTIMQPPDSRGTAWAVKHLRNITPLLSHEQSSPAAADPPLAPSPAVPPQPSRQPPSLATLTAQLAYEALTQPPNLSAPVVGVPLVAYTQVNTPLPVCHLVQDPPGAPIQALTQAQNIATLAGALRQISAGSSLPWAPMKAGASLSVFARASLVSSDLCLQVLW
jgi:hypothetical protein